MKKHRQNIFTLLFIKLSTSAIVLLTLLAPIHPLSAQEEESIPAQENWRKGEIKKGETLVSALRREAINGDSIREATQSLGKIFDFRLSRSNDRYEYTLNEKKQIEILRYYRANNTYETKWDGQKYEAKIINVPNQQANKAAEALIPPPLARSSTQVIRRLLKLSIMKLFQA